jgi:hypothetical protein
MVKKGNIPWNKGKKGLQVPWNKGLSAETDLRIYSGKDHPKFGKHLTEETKQKLSESHRGKHHTIETKTRMSQSRYGVNNKFYGRKHTEETKKKLSDKKKEAYKNGIFKPPQLGKPLSEDARIKISKANKGRRFSEETRLKMSLSHVGKKFPQEVKKKIADSWIGETNPAWNGGSSFFPYCPKFNKRLKNHIRERDNRTSQLCGTKEKGRLLHIHHVHYDRENCNPDLISLCNSCHTKVNHNRDHWESFFVDLLRQKGLLL